MWFFYRVCESNLFENPQQGAFRGVVVGGSLDQMLL